MMKEIFQQRLFCVILVILLLAVFVYPPFIVALPNKTLIYREWEWIFSPPVISVTSQELYKLTGETPVHLQGDIDLKMILAESIIAILLAIGVCLIPFSKGGKKKD
jgi:hypothetical protein